MDSPFQFSRLQDGQKLRTSELTEVMGIEYPQRERWLFVSPHDDDVVRGGSMWLLAATRSGILVDILVVTDG